MRMLRTGYGFLFLGALAALLPVPAAAQKKERDRIGREELLDAATKFPDLYLAIRGLRPHFLTVPRGPRTTNLEPSGRRGSPVPGMTGQEMRGSQSGDTPQIILYIDDAKAGDLGQLKNLLTINVEEVQYMSPNKAGAEFGLGHEGGAVLVKLFKGNKTPPN